MRPMITVFRHQSTADKLVFVIILPEISIVIFHFLCRSTPGGIHIDAGDAAQPLVPVYGGKIKRFDNSDADFKHEEIQKKDK